MIWGARDAQGQLDGVARNMSVYIKIEAARTDLGWAEPGSSVKPKLITSPTQLLMMVSIMQQLRSTNTHSQNASTSKVQRKNRNKYCLAISQVSSIPFFVFCF